VPSRWPEPFGIVALEGIACGCVVVGSSQGGLSEAIGLGGITFENGHCPSLAAALKRLLSDPALEESLRRAGPAHLRHFETSAVTRAYLQLMEEVVR
jgi:glycosyltransferase involved in cell wall biosynthesis